MSASLLASDGKGLRGERLFKVSGELLWAAIVLLFDGSGLCSDGSGLLWEDTGTLSDGSGDHVYGCGLPLDLRWLCGGLTVDSVD